MPGFHSAEILILITKLSAAAPIALLPTFACLLLDAAGWYSISKRISSRLPFSSALRIHVASEAIMKSIPLGAPLADTVRSLLLRQEMQIGMGESVPLAVSRRLHLGLAQGIFLAVCSLLTLSALRFIGSQVPPLRYGAIALPGIALALVVVSLTALSMLSSRRFRGSIERMALPLPRYLMRERIRHWLQNIPELHPEFMFQWGKTIGVLPWFIAYWCVEVLETYLFIALLGIPMDLSRVIAMEAIVSTLKLAGFFLPSGAGIQDLGYASILAGFGCIPNLAAAGSFLLLKRTKDVFWIALGYSLLFARGIRPFRKHFTAEAS
jgi:hypothetical protein